VQIAHTTISLNYLGEELETLDHEVFVVYADVPPQDGETDAQREEHRTPTPTGLLVGNKNSLQLLQPHVNTQLMLGKATTTSEDKYLQL
jgi:hypothetical protein